MTPMKTFKIHKLVLFKMKNCAPCLNAAKALDAVLEKNPEYKEHVTQLWKENHRALVAAYELKVFPTCLALDATLDEVDRRIGSKELSEEYWKETLSTIHQLESN